MWDKFQGIVAYQTQLWKFQCKIVTFFIKYTNIFIFFYTRYYTIFLYILYFFTHTYYLNSRKRNFPVSLPQIKIYQNYIDLSSTFFIFLIFHATAPHATQCCTSDGQVIEQMLSRDCYPIITPYDDPVYSKADIRCLNFVRSATDLDNDYTFSFKPAEQVWGFLRFNAFKLRRLFVTILPSTSVESDPQERDTTYIPLVQMLRNTMSSHKYGHESIIWLSILKRTYQLYLIDYQCITQSTSYSNSTFDNLYL